MKRQSFNLPSVICFLLYALLLGRAYSQFPTSNFDPSHQISQIQSEDKFDLSEVGNGTGFPTTGSTTTYSYDNARQLTHEDRSGSFRADYNFDYTYDPNGNRLYKYSNGSLAEQYNYFSNSDRLESVTAGNGSSIHHYKYDAEGNVTVVKNDLLQWVAELTYDSRNYVTNILYSDGHTNRFDTNAFGQRVFKQDIDGQNSYVRNGNAVDSPVINISGDNVNSVYSHGLGLVSEFSDGQSSWYSQDHLGTTNALYNNEGNAQNQLDYDAWGKNTQLSGEMNSPFGYGGSYGYQTDNDSGLTLAGHRYYDAGIGRFFSVDPIHDGLNWYAYVGNNPVSKIDPSGLSTVSITASGIAAVPGVAIWSDFGVVIDLGPNGIRDIGVTGHIGIGASGAFGASVDPAVVFDPNGKVKTGFDHSIVFGAFGDIGFGVGYTCTFDENMHPSHGVSGWGEGLGGGLYIGPQIGGTISLGQLIGKFEDSYGKEIQNGINEKNKEIQKAINDADSELQRGISGQLQYPNGPIFQYPPLLRW